MWAGVIVAEAGAWSRYARATPGGVAVVVSTAVAIGAAAALSVRWSLLRPIVAGLVAGLVCGSLYWSWWSHAAEAATSLVDTELHAEALTDPVRGQFGERSDVSVRIPVGGVRVGCRWSDERAAPEAGEAVLLRGRIKPPGTDEWGRDDHRDGRVGSLRPATVSSAGNARSIRGLVTPVRTRARAWIEAVAGPGGDLLAGVAIGDRRRLADTPADADFRTTGLTHLVAVSGGHLVVVAALLTALGRMVGLPRRLLVILVCAALGWYVVLSGVQASAVRAWLMACVVTVASLLDRRSDGVGALAGAVVVALALSPPNAFDLGFQLSVLAVGGLLVFSRLTETWVSALMPGVATGLAGPVAMTLVAQAVTTPLTASTFGTLSLVSPLANLIVGPLVSAVLTLGLGGLAFRGVVPPLGRVLLVLSGTAGAAAAWCAHKLAQLPAAAVPVAWGVGPAAAVLLAGVLALWLLWPRASSTRARVLGLAGVAVLLPVVWGSPPPSGARIVVLDVGQGDAILVQDGSSELLVDTGPDPGALKRGLLEQGVRTPDAVLVTHAHADHAAGLEAFGSNKAVDLGLCAGMRDPPSALAVPELDDVAAKVRVVRQGDALRVGRFTVRVVWPEGPVADAGANENCVLVEVATQGFSALLTADAESSVLDRLVAEHEVADVDVLKVGHHGSKPSVDTTALEALDPEYALISVGAGNRHGHPTNTALRLLEESGARVMRTDHDGSIIVEVGEGGYRVSQE